MRLRAKVSARKGNLKANFQAAFAVIRYNTPPFD